MSEPLTVLPPAAFKVTATDERVSPASALRANENKPTGVLDVLTVVGIVTSEVG